jgi:hypothetical protein
MPIDYGGDEEISKEEIEAAKKTAVKRESRGMMTHEETSGLLEHEEEARAMQEEIKAAKHASSPVGRLGRFLRKEKEAGESVYKGILAGQHPEYETPEAYPQKSRALYSPVRNLTKRLIGAGKEVERGESWFKKSVKELVEPAPKKPKPKKFEPKELYFTDTAKPKKVKKAPKPREKPLISEPMSYFKARKASRKRRKALKFGYMKDGKFVTVRMPRKTAAYLKPHLKKEHPKTSRKLTWSRGR